MVSAQQRWRTHALLVLIVLLSGYMLLFDHPHPDLYSASVAIDELEEEVESSRPVRHVSYKSPLDKNLFVPWTQRPPSPDQSHPAGWNGLQDAGLWGDHGTGDGAEDSRIINGQVGSTENAKARLERYRLIWKKAERLISENGLYPAYDPVVDEVLEAMNSARIERVDALNIGEYESGTAEKWLATLEGGQNAVIKVMWEEKGTMKRGALCNYGFEMPSAEIAAFHLHRVLGYNNTPYVTGRRLNLATEVLPVATPAISRQIILKRGNVTCLRGSCTHCKINHTMCPRDSLIEVSLAYWIPLPLKLHTYPIKYMPYSTTRMDEWGTTGFNNRTYCGRVRRELEPYTTDSRLFLDLFDFSALDSILYHYDSKHYSLENPGHPSHGITVRLDHGRAFCAHDRDEDAVFMAPIRQCCLMRRSSYERLRRLRGANKLRRKLEALLSRDPIAPILEPAWYPALERRLDSVLNMIDRCVTANGRSNVLIEDRRLNTIKF